jgi:hypothetical protein
MLSARDRRGWKKPPALTAANKLSNKEKDWNLVGVNLDPTATRTRAGGRGRPNLTARRKQFNEPESSDESESDPEWIEGVEEEDEDDDAEDLSEDESESPDNDAKATRVVLEVDTLMQTLEKYCRCEVCSAPLKPEMKTICIATSITLTCTNSSCGFIHYCQPPASATVGDPEAVYRERNTDSAVNILYVLGVR